MIQNFLRNSINFVGTLVVGTALSHSMDAAPMHFQIPSDEQIFKDYGNHYFYCEGTPEDHKGGSEIYKFGAPKVPLFHPYNVTGDDLGGVSSDMREVDLLPNPFYFPVFMKLPSEMVENFQRQFPNIIPENSTLDKIDYMISVQNMPWIQGRPVLYRPHYYLEPNAPYLAGYEHNLMIQANLYFLSGNPVSFSKNEMCSATHPAGPITVLSGDAGSSIVLNGVDNQNSSMLLTALQGDDRYAVTLHILLNDLDCENLRQISQALSLDGPLQLGDFVKGPLHALGDSLGENSIFNSLYDVLSVESKSY